MRNEHRIFVVNLGSRSLRRPRQRLEINVKMDLKEKRVKIRTG
jgi:hypothetical protein